ncbi:MAG: hypothetical protein HY720_28090 [Planctomycetes bacterium]|nr:hypothetical protein [Planctomycetota bacterium]
MPRSTLIPVLLASLALSPAAPADDALETGRRILEAQRAPRPELLGEEVWEVRIGTETVGYYRTVTRADEFEGKPVYAIRGSSLFQSGEERDLMEYVYYAYPDLSAAHYQRNRFSGGNREGEGNPGATPIETFLLVLQGDRWVLRTGEGGGEVPVEPGVVGFDLAPHLVRLLSPEEGSRTAFRMLDEDGTIRRIDFATGAREEIETSLGRVAAVRIDQSGLRHRSGAPLGFAFWVAGGKIPRFEARIGDGPPIRFEGISPERFRSFWWSPTDAAVEFLEALSRRDRSALANLVAFRESFFLSLSRNLLHQNLSDEELLGLWEKTGPTYREALLDSLVRDDPAAALAARRGPVQRDRLRAVESGTGERAVVRYSPEPGTSIYLYLGRGEEGWRVTYLNEGQK